MLGDVFDHFFAMFVVEFLVDCGTFERRGDIRASGNKRGVPQLCDIKSFKLGAQRFLQPDNHFFFDEIDTADEIVFSAERKLQGTGCAPRR